MPNSGQAMKDENVKFEIDDILCPTLQVALIGAASGADCPDYIPEHVTVEEFLSHELHQSHRLWPYQRRIRYVLPRAADVLEALRRLGFKVLDNILHWRVAELLRTLAQAWDQHKHQLC